MTQHSVNADFQRAGNLAFSFDESAPDCLQIVGASNEKILVEMDIHQTQKLYAFLYTRHHEILALLEAARSAKE